MMVDRRMSLPADVIADALAAASRGDEDARWDCVCALQREGTPAVLAAAVGLCESLGPEERALGADILGQLGGLGALAPYREQSSPVLARLLEDPDPVVKAAAVRAHGHLWLQAN